MVTPTKGLYVRGSERENSDVARDKDLTLAPLCCGLNVACLFGAGTVDRGLNDLSPLQEQLWDWHGMELMH